MGELLKNGQAVRGAETGASYRVEKFLGGGGQGEVYCVTNAGKPLALKWYFPHYLAADPFLRDRLTEAVRSGAPTEKFLWPLELADADGSGTFGYLMPLREERFKSVGDIIRGRINPSFRARATTCFEVASSYLQLHAKGLCYRDISLGNLFFDPTTGEARICDNDNVDVNKRKGPISGTPEFMAPEIVRGEASPSAQTDLFSLALLLFYILCVNHALKGRRMLGIHVWDPAAQTKMLGSDPLFIFDPADRANEAVPAAEDDLREAGANALNYWPLYPQFLRDLFTQSFTTGLKDPDHGRVTGTTWMSAMVRLRDSILYCPACGKQNFYDAQALRATGSLGGCWACRSALTVPARLRVEQNVILLNPDTRLFPHHVDARRTWDFSAPVAEVARHPSDPTVLGLRNLSGEKWVITTTDGSLRDVETGKSLTLTSGTRIQFGKSEGEIRL